MAERVTQSGATRLTDAEDVRVTDDHAGAAGIIGASQAREPIQYVVIHQDFCPLTYGTAPCQAALDVTGTRKCYNTRATCQDPDNYDAGVLSVGFSKPHTSLPKGTWSIPSVVSVSHAPTKLNIGAGNRNAGPLGTRAVATVVFQDHPYPDRKVDKYLDERDFDPLERGTFWTKWLARNPFYQNRCLTIYDGFVGQEVVEMIRRDFLVDRIEGPSSSGTVRVVAKDPLKLAEDKRAQVPLLSTGELEVGISATTESFTVSPAVLDDYPASGTLRIGREVMTYTARTEDSGSVTFTGVVRGTDGSVADDHDGAERAQICLRYTIEPVADILYDLLTAHGNVPATYIDKAAWDAEAVRWLEGFELSALITEPTAVDALVGEIAEQVPLFIWWDERARLIKMRADRRDEVEPAEINDRDNIVAGSVAIKEDPSQRVSQIWVYWDQGDPTVTQTDEGNYRRIRIRADLEAEGDAQYGESRIRKIFARWITTEAQATVLSRRLQQRYGSNPRFMTLTLDAKDSAIWTADLVNAATRLVTDDTGATISHLYQVIEARESDPGHAIDYELQKAAFESDSRVGRWMRPEAPGFLAASDEDKADGFFWSGEDGNMSDGSEGYNWQ